MTGIRKKTIGFGFALGFFATLSQILLMREFWALPGLGELSLGMLLCSWLAYIATGAQLGRWIPFRLVPIGIVLGVSTLLLPGALLLVRFYEFFFAVSPGEPLDTSVFLILCTTAPLPGAVLSGLLFTSFSKQLLHNVSNQIQWIYVAEGAGAAVSGLLYAFALSELSGPLTLLLTTFSGLAVASIVAVPTRWTRIRWLIPLLPLSAALFTVALALDTRTLTDAFELQPVRGHCLGCLDTRYQRLCLGELAEQKQLYQDGRLAYVFPDPFERPRPVHLAMTQHPAPKRVLIIGGGVANRLDAAALYHPAEIHYLDLDPQVLPFLAPWRSPSDNRLLQRPDVMVHAGYHRAFLKQFPNYFDVIVQFAAPPFTAAENASHTVSFYRTVARGLTQSGVFTVVSGGSANVSSPPAAQLLSSRYNTLRAVFPNVVPVIDVETLFFASRGSKPTLNPDRIDARLSRADAALPYIINPPELLSKRRLQRSLATVTRYHGDINVDDHPRTFLHVLELQRWIRKSSLTTLSDVDWQQIERNSDSIIRSTVAGTVIFLLAVAVLFVPIPRNSRISFEIISIATTGLCGLGLEVVLIYWFSVIHGGLYHHIAWLLAGFMSGLSAGAVVGNRLARIRYMPLLADGLVILTIGFAIWLISQKLSWPLPFALAMVMAGVATGFAFPVCLHGAEVRQSKNAVSLLVSADHLGAAAGAILVSTLWLPELGLYWTCVLMLLFKVPLLVKYWIKNG